MLFFLKKKKKQISLRRWDWRNSIFFGPREMRAEGEPRSVLLDWLWMKQFGCVWMIVGRSMCTPGETRRCNWHANDAQTARQLASPLSPVQTRTNNISSDNNFPWWPWNFFSFFKKSKIKINSFLPVHGLLTSMKIVNMCSEVSSSAWLCHQIPWL